MMSKTDWITPGSPTNSGPNTVAASNSAVRNGMDEPTVTYTEKGPEWPRTWWRNTITGWVECQHQPGLIHIRLPPRHEGEQSFNLVIEGDPETVEYERDYLIQHAEEHRDRYDKRNQVPPGIHPHARPDAAWEKRA